MSDWPAALALGNALWTLGYPEGFRIECASLNQAASNDVVWPAANEAIYVPIRVLRAVLVSRLWVVNGTVINGNIDVGVYRQDGTRIVAAGSTAQAAGLQFFDVTDTALPPGRYYLAVASSSATARVYGATPAAVAARALGICKQGTAFALPSSATFALTDRAYVPNVGMQIGRAT